MQFKKIPLDFMVRLSVEEWNLMRSQFVTASQRTRNISTTPYAFTEQGLAMLSGVLNSEKAINMNIVIMRAFLLVRQYATTYKELGDELRNMEIRYSKKFKDIYEALNYLLKKDEQELQHKKRNKIGFKK